MGKSTYQFELAFNHHEYYINQLNEVTYIRNIREQTCKSAKICFYDFSDCVVFVASETVRNHCENVQPCTEYYGATVLSSLQAFFSANTGQWSILSVLTLFCGTGAIGSFLAFLRNFLQQSPPALNQMSHSDASGSSSLSDKSEDRNNT